MGYTIYSILYFYISLYLLNILLIIHYVAIYVPGPEARQPTLPHVRESRSVPPRWQGES